VTMSLSEYLDLVYLLLKVINITSEYGGKRDMLLDVTRVILADIREVWGDQKKTEGVNDIPF
jgi:hypothetical protein